MMNWIFGRPKSNLPEPTALQTQRAKQIEQLKAFNQNVSEIHRDVEYRVNFVVNGTSISLYITLPPQFPSEKPFVKVSPALRHPWVNDQMVVTGCPGINSFVVHSDLGKVIRQVVDEFQRVRPTILPYSSAVTYPPAAPPTLPATYQPPYQPPVGGYNPPGYRMPMPPSLHASTTPSTQAAPLVPPPSISSVRPPPFPHISPIQQSSSVALGGYQPPEIPSSFPQLRDLSVQELQSLTDDEDKLIQVMKTLPQLEQISKDREFLCQQNEQLAEENLSKKPLLEDMKRSLLEKYDLLNDLRRKFDENSTRQEYVQKQFNPSAIQVNLKVAALQAEEESEHIAEKFLSGSISVEEFNKMYMDRRKLSHLRKAKEEKLSQYMVRHQTGYKH